ncbi:MAG: hypothetical protein KAW94_01475 [Candidatus Thorarchaeota archaeon]|nr:hypothetical protein [Candidatus Thorarchaeota archaeon]
MTEILSEELIETLKPLENPKFMATKDNSGEPNIAFVLSWTVYPDSKKLVYGEFITNKTRKNLEAGNNELGLLVMTTGLDSWMIRADFESYHKNDEIYEFMVMTPLFRYNQYTSARSVGVAHPLWSSPNYKISKPSVLLSYVKAKLAARKIPTVKTDEGNMPRNVMERFSWMAAVKAIAFVEDDGYLSLFPSFGIVPASSNRLVVHRSEEKRRGLELKDGQRVAVSLVTLEPAAFQVKGTFRVISDSVGVIDLDRVYACSAPRPGVRVDIPMLERI